MTRSCACCGVAVAILVLRSSARLAAGSTAGSPPATDSQSGSSAAPATVAQTREEITRLEPGKTIERELAGVQKDVFQITLSEGQVASIIVEGRSIDLTLRWVDAQGTAVTEELRPGQTQDIFDFVAEKSGAYQIQLQPIYPKAPAGKYRLRIGAVRAASENDLLLYEARR